MNLMSRHVLMSKISGNTVTVGWDAPLQTFFAQVLRDAGDECDPVVLWLGTSTREYPVADSLVAPLQPYADLDSAMLSQLRFDLSEASDRRPSALQRRLRF